MKVKIKKLHEDAIIPKYHSKGAAGFDFHALEDMEIAPGETKLIKTGLSFEIEEGFELQVRPRSGTSLKTKLRLANSPGTIDADYRGEVCIIMDNISEEADTHHRIAGNPCINFIFIKKGERYAQGVFAAVIRADFEEVEELTQTERGQSGFGSSGK
jgi:dUTP pyrophosphatase